MKDGAQSKENRIWKTANCYDSTREKRDGEKLLEA